MLKFLPLAAVLLAPLAVANPDYNDYNDYDDYNSNYYNNNDDNSYYNNDNSYGGSSYEDNSQSSGWQSTTTMNQYVAPTSAYTSAYMASTVANVGAGWYSSSTSYTSTSTTTVEVWGNMTTSTSCTEEAASTVLSQATSTCPPAGYPPYCSSSDLSSYSPPTFQVVQVGYGGKLAYYPEKVWAIPGSIVQFQFNPHNHTVSESTFGQPCEAITKTDPSSLTPDHPGTFSGFVPVPEDIANNTQTDVAIFNVLINDTSPIWIFCGQTGHCPAGMSMVINEECGGNSLEEYQAAASLLASSSSSYSGYSGYSSGSYSSWGSSSAYSAAYGAAATSSASSDISTYSSMMTSTTASPAALSASVFSSATTTSAALPSGVSNFTGAAGNSKAQGLRNAMTILGLTVFMGIIGTLF